MNMNINEDYGNVELPSEIADSFEHQDSHSSIKAQHANIDGNYDIKHSRYIDEDLNGSHEFREQESDIHLDSSFEDTFLANLPLLIQKQNARENKDVEQEQPQIAINKTKILRNVLPNEEVVQFVQVINPSSQAIILTVSSPLQIQILSTEGYQINFDNNFTNNNVKEFFLQPWQKIQIGFKIKRGQDQFGDIFETISLQYRYQQKQKKNKNGATNKKKRAFIEVEVHYITPKLKMSYQGCSDVATICLNKVSLNKVAKNKFGEHSLLLGVSGVERFECTLEARGDLKIFPNQLILYKDETKKINFKPPSSKGAIIIKAKNAKVSFVFGIQLI